MILSGQTASMSWLWQQWQTRPSARFVASHMVWYGSINGNTGGAGALAAAWCEVERGTAKATCSRSKKSFHDSDCQHTHTGREWDNERRQSGIMQSLLAHLCMTGSGAIISQATRRASALAQVAKGKGEHCAPRVAHVALGLTHAEESRHQRVLLQHDKGRVL